MKGSREKLRKDQASELAAKHLQAIEAEVGCELVILEAETLEEEFGDVP